MRVTPRILIQTLALVATLGILSWLTWSQIRLALDIGYGLTPLIDPYSEANGIRGGQGHVEKGFAAHWGLSDLAHGDQFTDTGRTHFIGTGRPDIYTSYPPAPEWIIALSMHVFGIRNVPMLRMVPITICALCMAVFASFMMWRLGAVRAALLIGLLAPVPAFSNMMHYLHCWGYLLAFQLVEFGLLIWLFRRWPEPRLPAFLVLLMAGFIQGWFTFDYAFLITFLPVVAWLDQPRFWRLPELAKLFAFGFALGLGVLIAHYIHFLQVIAVDGSFAAAKQDLLESGRARFLDDPRVFGPGGLNYMWLRFQVWGTEDPKLFGWRFGPLLVAVFGLFSLRLLFLDRLFTIPFVLRWRSRLIDLVSLAFTYGLCWMWILLMRPHAIQNQPALTRHFFLFVLVAAFLIVRGLEFGPRSRADEVKGESQTDAETQEEAGREAAAPT